MKVVYTNSRGDKCLWEVSIVWCKQINHNKFGQHSMLEIATVGKVFPFTFFLPSHLKYYFIELWVTPNNPSERELRYCQSKNKQPFLIPIFTLTGLESLRALLWLFIHFSFLAPKTPLFFSNWLQRMALFSFPSVHLSQSEKQNHRIVEGTSGGHLVLLTQGHLEPAAQDCIQLVLGYLQGGRPCSLFRPPATYSRNSYKEERWKHTHTRVAQHLQILTPEVTTAPPDYVNWSHTHPEHHTTHPEGQGSCFNPHLN